MTSASYPAKADSALVNEPIVVAIAFRLILCDGGLRADRGGAGGDALDQHPLRLRVHALSYRQRLVRRLPAHRGLRHGHFYYGPWYPAVVALVRAGTRCGRLPVHPRCKRARRQKNGRNATEVPSRSNCQICYSGLKSESLATDRAVQPQEGQDRPGWWTERLT